MGNSRISYFYRQNDLKRICRPHNQVYTLTKYQRAQTFLSFLHQLENKKLVNNMAGIKDWVNDDGKGFSFNRRQNRNVFLTAMGITRGEEPQDPK